MLILPAHPRLRWCGPPGAATEPMPPATTSATKPPDPSARPPRCPAAGRRVDEPVGDPPFDLGGVGRRQCQGDVPETVVARVPGDAADVAGRDGCAAELMRGVGNLRIGAVSYPRYDATRRVELFIKGLHRPN